MTSVGCSKEVRRKCRKGYAKMRNYSIIPLEISEHTDLDNFDEYEAHKYGWPDELIRAALREIDQREYYENEADKHCFYCGTPLDDTGFCWNPECG